MVEIDDVHEVLSDDNAIRSEDRGSVNYFYLENQSYKQIWIANDKWKTQFSHVELERIRNHIDHSATDVSVIDLSQLPEHEGEN